MSWVSHALDFEQPLVLLEEQIAALTALPDMTQEVAFLKEQLRLKTENIYAQLTAWQKVQVARHGARPQSPDYIAMIFKDFDALKGDRLYGQDPALVTGLGELPHGQTVLLIAQRKGKNLEQRLEYHFGMMHPEGYRQAARLAQLAEKFHIPIVTLIDTPGAYAGVGAEERGQSRAIAHNLALFSQLKVPIINIVIGEGCSGGALGIGVGDRLLMLQYSYFATISPEGCAAILFKSAEKTPQMAEMMKITAADLYAAALIDGIIEEPLGGAHRAPEIMAQTLAERLEKEISLLQQLSQEDLVRRRYHKIMQHSELIDVL
jgi:acetyl-CoA carboxylase carboxyl transferase subunit alpha